MAKTQTRRSVSLNRSTYERLRAYCETNGLSMSQFVETRIGDFLGGAKRTRQELTSTPRAPTSPPKAPGSHIFTF